MSRKRILVPKAREEVDQLKYAIENGKSFLPGESLADYAGSVGGEMTKQLVALGEQQLMQKKKTG